MQIEKRDSSQERRIVTALIVDPTVLGKLAPLLDGSTDLFRSKWSNLIASWCGKHWSKYGKAPGKDVEALFISWATESRDADTIKLVERFLGGLSGEYEQQAEASNSQYLLDLAGQHFNKNRIQQLKDALDVDLSNGETVKALERISKFGRVEVGGDAVVDVLHSKETWREVFTEDLESLITYPGALGKMLNKAMKRDSFVVIAAPEKRGKSWTLLDIAWQAMRQRRKVAFFEVGDMSRNQIMRRWGARAAERPLRAKTVKLPVSITADEDRKKTAEVVFEEKTWEDALSWREAWAGCQKVVENRLRSREPYLQLSVHPTSTINVSGIQSILQTWERDGWVADVIVIDYSDILAPQDGRKDVLHQINETYAALRALSQSLHCLVVTATQTNAASYSSDLIDRKHFSGNKLKMAHCTAMIGLNQTSEEKTQQILRLNYVVLREDEFHTGRCCHVAGCLAVANPFMVSIF